LRHTSLAVQGAGRVNIAEHFLDDRVTHAFWDNAAQPRLEIEPGDTVIIECQEATDGQITPNSTAEIIGDLNFDRIHALSGPIFVQGAQPGDVLEIEILDMQHKGWGWSAHLPGFGLLAEDFDFPYLQHWQIEGDCCRSDQLPDVSVPFEPHPGCVGVAPQEPGRLDTIPPRFNGGNVDIRDMVIGSTIFMPVFAEGALFSTGDCHAAQGQGEVCGTGIESPMTVTMRFDVRKEMNLRELQLQRPSPMSKMDASGYHITTAHGPDLMENAKNALRYMIDWLESAHGLSRSQAYILCGAIADMKISQIVDAPNWIVSAHIPLSVF
jgi:acetamidase/formamidase